MQVQTVLGPFYLRVAYECVIPPVSVYVCKYSS